MNLREGAVYVDGRGVRIGPMEYDPVRKLMKFRVDKKIIRTYTLSGFFYNDGRDCDDNLVSEWIEPVDPEAVTPIDLVPLDHFRRGVDKIWDSYKLLP